MQPRIGFALVTVLVLVLAGCGGGGNSGSSPAAPTLQDQANAKAAVMTGSYDLGSHMLSVSWTDAFSPGTAFQVEQQQSDGTWSKIDSVPGASGSQPTLTWNRSVTATAKFRVEAVLAGYNVPLQTAGNAQEIDFTPPAPAPALTIGTTQPISVPTDLSITGGGTYSKLTYSVDGKSIGSTTIGPAYLLTLDPAGFVAGAHQLQAQLTVSPDLTLVLAQSVQLASPELAVAFEMSNPGLHPGDPGYVEVVARASSDFGITAVQAFQDSKSLGVLTAPNGCSKYCVINGTPGHPALDEYVFPTNTITAGSGTHVISVHATDGNGQTGSVTQQIVFNNPPVVSITAPLDGALVNGNLTLTGTASTDKTGALTTVATLNGTQILSSTSTNFSTSYSLASLAPGSYTLTITSTDADNTATTVKETVTVTSSAALAFTPVTTLGADGALLAAESSTVLIRIEDGSVHLRSGTTDTKLQDTDSLTSAVGWVVANGNVFATAVGSDRLSVTSVYSWAPDGTRRNLSTLAASTGVRDTLVAAHGSWAVFLSVAPSNSTAYTFYNVSTATKVSIPVPAGATSVVADGDFYLSAGNLVFYYGGVTGPSTPSTAIDIFRWDQATAQSTRVTTSGLNQGFIHTDGTRVAWATSAGAIGNPPDGLVALNIASNTPTSLSTILGIRFYLADGLLSWEEQSLSAGGIKVSDGTNVTVLSARLSSVLDGTGMGYVLFEDAGVLKYWTAAGGSQTLFDGSPGHALFSGKTAYFTNGVSQALYAVPLP